MVYTSCNVNLGFLISYNLYTSNLTHVTLYICIRYSGTSGVMKHFDFMRLRTLRMCHLEKLFVARRIRLYEYAFAPNVRYTFIHQMFLMLTYIHSVSHNFHILYVYRLDIFGFLHILLKSICCFTMLALISTKVLTLMYSRLMYRTAHAERPI